jgi:quaternary ammonium compound-resistance protein SugE
MNWVIPIIAGLFEVAFTSCLEKAKVTTGQMMYLWYGAFLLASAVSMFLLAKATQNISLGTASPA